MRRVYIRKNKQNTIIAAILGITSICICGQLFTEQSSQSSPATAAIPTSTSQETNQTEPYEETVTPISPTAESLEKVSLPKPDCISEQQPLKAYVTNVVDGDTIKVNISGEEFSVRLIGINTPEIAHVSEVAEYFGNEAAQKTKDLVSDKHVWLYKDVSETDQYGRLLRYVMVDDIFLNETLVSEGYAYAVTYPPDVACAQDFVHAQEYAVENTTGLWAQTPEEQTASEAIITIATIFYNGVGGNNEPDEYVSIVNQGNEPVAMKGWTIRDESGKTFHFPDIQIEPGQTCRIYTNEDHPESCGLNWHYTNSAIWNNGGDTCFLSNSSNEIVAEYRY